MHYVGFGTLDFDQTVWQKLFELDWLFLDWAKIVLNKTQGVLGYGARAHADLEDNSRSAFSFGAALVEYKKWLYLL
jgi:hypothetical protein